MERSREADDYLQRYQDVFANDYFRQNPFEHYSRYGQNEGRQWGGMMSGPPVNQFPHGSPPQPPPQLATGGGQGLASVPSYQPPPVERERPSTPLPQNPTIMPSTQGPIPTRPGVATRIGGMVGGTQTGGLKPRVPPGNFDPNMYLKLNPDVKSSGIDPYTHYVMFGMDEGRKYQIPTLFNPTPMDNLGNDVRMRQAPPGTPLNQPVDPRAVPPSFTPPPFNATPIPTQGGPTPQPATPMGGGIGGNMISGSGQPVGGGQATPWDLLQRMAAYRGARPAGG